MADVLLIVSIDTEEDNWARSRRGITVANIGELPRLATFLDRLRIRPTYFVTHAVASDERAAELLRAVSAGGRAEIGAHLHPWNTPPLSEAVTPRNSMLKNLPADLQLAKLQTLTATLARAFGTRPQSFRAGRYGLGASTVSALLRCGYQVDSSVTPFVSWQEFDDGPTFVGAPLGIYRLAEGREVTQPAEAGPLIEVPLSCGFIRGPFSLWGGVHRALAAPGLRTLRRFCRPTVLSPELAPVEAMVTLSQRLLDRGVRHLHLSWHSPSLIPGLSPFAATAPDVARLYASVAEYVDRLAGLTSVTCVTVSEAAARLAEPARPQAAAC